MKKVANYLTILFLIFILTGCWDVQDITSRAYITTIGFDRVKEGDTEDFQATFEIVLPNKFNLENEKASFVETVEAASIGSAMEKLQTRVPRDLSLAHVRVVLLGEEFAKEKNFLDIADFFQRNPNMQMRIRFLLVKDGEAKDILKQDPIYDKYIAKELVAMSQLDFALTRANSFFDFVTQLRVHDGSGLIGRTLISTEDKMIIRQGVGVYNNWRLYQWLSGEETNNLNWLLDEESFIVDAKYNKGLYTYMVDDKSVQINPIQNDEDLRFVVKIKTRGPLMQEQGQYIDATDPKVLGELESVFSRKIKQEVESAVAKAQQDIKVDYLGFDTALRQVAEDKFEQLDWKKVFPTIPVTVEIDADVIRFGLSK